jgi:hypothetical protein
MNELLVGLKTVIFKMRTVLAGNVKLRKKRRMLLQTLVLKIEDLLFSHDYI